MAAGVVTVAHDSGGPKRDIVETDDAKRTGFLADTTEGYANCIERVLASFFRLPEAPDWTEEMTLVRQRARASVGRFSDEAFTKGWRECMKKCP